MEFETQEIKSNRCLCIVKQNENIKLLLSKELKYFFNKKSGLFIREGELEDKFNPFGTEIADIEITTKCNGVSNNGVKQLCKFCYKSNNPKGLNMSLETYKRIIDLIKPVATQVALGVDSEANSNPDLEKMLNYTRTQGLVPNLTVAELTDEKAKMLAKYCGAVAVSCYEDKNVCYDTVKKLIDNKMEQVNIHYMLSEETYEKAFEIIDDIKKDKRLERLNAIVFLSLKQKEKGKNFTCLSFEKFKRVFNHAMVKQVTFGFDSCSANKVFEIIKTLNNFEENKKFVEPCESTAFSAYFDINGNFYPCSFVENEGDWKQGISVFEVETFNDIWYDKKTIEFRNKLLENLDSNGCRKCNYFEV